VLVLFGNSLTFVEPCPIVIALNQPPLRPGLVVKARRAWKTSRIVCLSDDVSSAAWGAETPREVVARAEAASQS